MGCFTERASPNGACPPGGSGTPSRGPAPLTNDATRRVAVAVAVAVEVEVEVEVEVAVAVAVEVEVEDQDQVQVQDHDQVAC
jgi:hypothetical protein